MTRPTTIAGSPSAAATVDRIIFADVRVRQNQTDILKGVDWHVRAGEHWAILGPNGSGKTSLIMALYGFLPFSHGRIYLIEGWVGQVFMPEIREKIGMVSHALADRFLHNMPRATAVEVVLTGHNNSYWLMSDPGPVAHERARHILTDLGCARLAQLPFRLLSSGERQAAMLARSVMADNELIFLDEPCANLDLGARERLLTVVQRLLARPHGPTITYITHHPEEIAPGISHLLLLKDGKTLTAGPIADVMQDGLLSAAFGLPLQVQETDGRYLVRARR